MRRCQSFSSHFFFLRNLSSQLGGQLYSVILASEREKKQFQRRKKTVWYSSRESTSINELSHKMRDLKYRDTDGMKVDLSLSLSLCLWFYYICVFLFVSSFLIPICCLSLIFYLNFHNIYCLFLSLIYQSYVSSIFINSSLTCFSFCLRFYYSYCVFFFFASINRFRDKVYKVDPLLSISSSLLGISFSLSH